MLLLDEHNRKLRLELTSGQCNYLMKLLKLSDKTIKHDNLYDVLMDSSTSELRKVASSVRSFVKNNIIVEKKKDTRYEPLLMKHPSREIPKDYKPISPSNIEFLMSFSSYLNNVFMIKVGED